MTEHYCVTCKHCDKASGWWDFWLCRASPLPTNINPVTGEEMRYYTHDGKRIFTGRRHCAEVNLDGKCVKWESETN